MTKSQRYYYDIDAVRVPSKTEPHSPGYVDGELYAVGPMDRGGHSQREQPDRVWGDKNGRNLWNYWIINSEGYRGAHFATFPRALVTPCIKAGTSAKGCCSGCGNPWERIVETEQVGDVENSWSGRGDSRRDPATRTDLPGTYRSQTHRTLRWEATCECDRECVPCVVFDPFVGSGTSLVVANALGRHGIGLDLSRDYLANQAQRRVNRPHAPVRRPAKDEEAFALAGLS